MIAQALGGIMSITGQPEGEPTRLGSSIGDIIAGMFGAIGIVSALYERVFTSRGLMVDVAMLDGQVAVLENDISRYAIKGEVPGLLVQGIHLLLLLADLKQRTRGLSLPVVTKRFGKGFVKWLVVKT